MNDLCTEVRFVVDDHTAPASVERCHTSRWMTDVGNDPVRLRYFCHGATIECAGLSARDCGGPTCFHDLFTLLPWTCGPRAGPMLEKVTEGLWLAREPAPTPDPETVTIDIKWREGSPFAKPLECPPEQRVCNLLGRHEFGDGSTCSRCGIMREMLADGVPRRKRRWRSRGPFGGPIDDVDPELEAARNRALDMMGEALDRRRRT